MNNEETPDERAAAIEVKWRRIGLMDGADAEYLLAEVKRLHAELGKGGRSNAKSKPNPRG
jgi:hypothetical protein